MLRPSIIVMSLLILATSANRTAQAQLYPVWDSVESRVAKADTVVVGRVVGIKAASESERLEDQHSMISIAVDEVLRGTAPARLTIDGYYAFWEGTPARAAACDTCPEHSHRFLITLHTENSNLTFFDLDKPTAFDVTADLQPLRGGEAILRAAREEIKRCGKQGHPATYSWDPHGTPLLPPEMQQTSVIVPVDRRQEALALFILRTQSPLYDTDHLYGNDRPDAVKALKPFHSSSNEKLLKALLSDPQTWHSIEPMAYPVRRAAYEVLEAWHLSVERPVLTVSVAKPVNK